MPQSVGDYVVMLLVILGLLAIPLAFYPLLVAKFLPLPSKKPFIITFVCLVIYIIGYGIFNSNGRLRISKVVDEMIDLFAIHIPHMIFPFCCMVDLAVLIFSPEDQQGVPLMVLIYFVIIKILWVIYKGIKDKWYKMDREVIQNAKNERNQIKILKKLIKKEKQLIKNDKDEEEYSLKDFDSEIESLQLQIENNKVEKKNSLVIFENETKPEISSKISEKYATSIKEFESKIKEIQSKKNILIAEHYQVALKISKEYEVFLGKENLSLKTIDSLISLIENKNANNISEALYIYKTMNMLHFAPASGQ